MSELSDKHEQQVLDAFRQAKQFGHADIRIAIKDGVLINLELNRKFDVGSARKIREQNPA